VVVIVIGSVVVIGPVIVAVHVNGNAPVIVIDAGERDRGRGAKRGLNRPDR
jgi:hypothetical protein